MEDCPMNEAFDKVTLSFFGCCDYEGSWTPGEPFPSGWGRESEARENGYVCASEFDRVLAALNEAKAEISKLSTRMDQLLASETEAVEALAWRDCKQELPPDFEYCITDGDNGVAEGWLQHIKKKPRWALTRTPSLNAVVYHWRPLGNPAAPAEFTPKPLAVEKESQ